MPKFNTRQEWADYAVRVLRSYHGTVYVNMYCWRRGRDLQTALRHAQKMDLVICTGGRWDNREYKLTRKGWEWKVLPPKQCKSRSSGNQAQRKPSTSP